MFLLLLFAILAAVAFFYRRRAEYWEQLCVGKGLEIDGLLLRLADAAQQLNDARSQMAEQEQELNKQARRIANFEDLVDQRDNDVKNLQSKLRFQIAATEQQGQHLRRANLQLSRYGLAQTSIPLTGGSGVARPQVTPQTFSATTRLQIAPHPGQNVSCNTAGGASTAHNRTAASFAFGVTGPENQDAHWPELLRQARNEAIRLSDEADVLRQQVSGLQGQVSELQGQNLTLQGHASELADVPKGETEPSAQNLVASQSQLFVLQAEIGKLRGALAQESKSVQVYVGELATAAAERDTAAAAERDTAAAEAGALSTRLTTASQDMRRLQETITQLQSEVAKAHAAEEAAGQEAAKLQNQVAQLQSERDAARYAAENAAAEANAAAVVAMNAELEVAREQYRAARRELDEAAAARSADVEALRNQVKAGRQKLELAEARVADAAADAEFKVQEAESRLASTIAQLHQDKAGLQAEAKELRNRTLHLKEEAAARLAEAEGLQKRIAELEAAVQISKAVVDSGRQDVVAAAAGGEEQEEEKAAAVEEEEEEEKQEDAKNEVSTLKAELKATKAELENRVAAAEDASVRAAEMEAELALLRQRVSRFQQEIEQAQADRDQLLGQFAGLQGELEGAKQQVINASTQMAQDRNTLQIVVDELEVQLQLNATRDAELEGCSTTVGAIGRRLAGMEGEASRHFEDIADGMAGVERLVDDMSARLQESNDRCTFLTAQATETAAILDHVRRERGALQQVRSALQSEVAHLKAERDEAQAALQQAQAAMAAEREALDAKVRELSTSIAALDVDHTSASDDCVFLQAERDALTAEVRDLAAKFEAAAAEAGEATRARARLEAEMQEMAARYEAAVAEVQEAVAKYGAATAEVRELSEAKARLEAEKEAQVKEIADRCAQANEKVRELESAQSEATEAETAQRQDQEARLQGQLSEAQGRLAAAEANAQRLEDELGMARVAEQGARSETERLKAALADQEDLVGAATERMACHRRDLKAASAALEAAFGSLVSMEIGNTLRAMELNELTELQERLTAATAQRMAADTAVLQARLAAAEAAAAQRAEEEEEEEGREKEEMASLRLRLAEAEASSVLEGLLASVELSALQERLREQEVEAETVRHSVAEAQAALALRDAEAAEARQECEGLREQLEELRAAGLEAESGLRAKLAAADLAQLAAEQRLAEAADAEAARVSELAARLAAAEASLAAARSEQGSLVKLLAEAESKLTSLASAADVAIRTAMSASSAAAAAVAAVSAAAAPATAAGTGTPGPMGRPFENTPMLACRTASMGEVPVAIAAAVTPAVYGTVSGGASSSGASSAECTPQRDQDGPARSVLGQGVKGGATPAAMVTATAAATTKVREGRRLSSMPDVAPQLAGLSSLAAQLSALQAASTQAAEEADRLRAANARYQAELQHYSHGLSSLTLAAALRMSSRRASRSVALGGGGGMRGSTLGGRSSAIRSSAVFRQSLAAATADLAAALEEAARAAAETGGAEEAGEEAGVAVTAPRASEVGSEAAEAAPVPEAAGGVQEEAGEEAGDSSREGVEEAGSGDEVGEDEEEEEEGEEEEEEEEEEEDATELGGVKRFKKLRRYWEALADSEEDAARAAEEDRLALEAQAEEMQRVLRRAQDVLAAEAQRLATLRAERAALEAARDKAVSERDDLAGRCKALDDRVSELSSQVRQLVSEQDVMDSKLKRLVSERDEAVMEQERQTRERNALMHRVSEAGGMVAKLKEERRAMEQELEASAEVHSRRAEELAAREAEVQEALALVRGDTGELAHVAQGLTGVADRLASLLGVDFEELREGLTAGAALGAKVGLLESRVGQLPQLDERVAELQGQLEQAGQREQQVQAQAERAEADKERLRQLNSELVQQVAQLKGRQAQALAPPPSQALQHSPLKGGAGAGAGAGAGGEMVLVPRSSLSDLTANIAEVYRWIHLTRGTPRPTPSPELPPSGGDRPRGRRSVNSGPLGRLRFKVPGAADADADAVHPLEEEDEVIVEESGEGEEGAAHVAEEVFEVQEGGVTPPGIYSNNRGNRRGRIGEEEEEEESEGSTGGGGMGGRGAAAAGRGGLSTETSPVSALYVPPPVVAMSPFRYARPGDGMMNPMYAHDEDDDEEEETGTLESTLRAGDGGTGGGADAEGEEGDSDVLCAEDSGTAGDISIGGQIRVLPHQHYQQQQRQPALAPAGGSRGGVGDAPQPPQQQQMLRQQSQPQQPPRNLRYGSPATGGGGDVRQSDKSYDTLFRTEDTMMEALSRAVAQLREFTDAVNVRAQAEQGEE